MFLFLVDRYGPAAIRGVDPLHISDASILLCLHLSIVPDSCRLSFFFAWVQSRAGQLYVSMDVLELRHGCLTNLNCGLG